MGKETDRGCYVAQIGDKAWFKLGAAGDTFILDTLTRRQHERDEKIWCRPTIEESNYIPWPTQGVSGHCLLRIWQFNVNEKWCSWLTWNVKRGVDIQSALFIQSSISNSLNLPRRRNIQCQIDVIRLLEILWISFSCGFWEGLGPWQRSHRPFASSTHTYVQCSGMILST